MAKIAVVSKGRERHVGVRRFGSSGGRLRKVRVGYRGLLSNSAILHVGSRCPHSFPFISSVISVSPEPLAQALNYC